MIIKYLLILGIGHLLGDFYFQNRKIAEYKDKKYKGVCLHALEYYIAALLVILPVFSADMVLAATYLAFAHLAIDTAKYVLLIKGTIRKDGNVFVIDQCAHILSIFLLAYMIACRNFSMGHIEIVNNLLNIYKCDAERVARWILALLFIHIPANLFIQNFLEDYKPKGNDAIIRADNRAGRRIGTIERLIMLILVSMDQYVAMGFVLTAKSIARYDRITKDEKFAEYYLLGTLISSLCVIICRILILK